MQIHIFIDRLKVMQKKIIHILNACDVEFAKLIVHILGVLAYNRLLCI